MSDTQRADAVVIGGGSFGTALATVLARVGKEVQIWVRRPELAVEINTKRINSRYLPEFDLPRKGLTAVTDLAGAVRSSHLVLMAVPSQSFREVARAAGDHLSGDQLVVHVTKGFEIETFKRMSQVLREETCALKIGVMSGPTLAKEMMAGHPAGALVASRYDEVVQHVQKVFEGGALRVYGGRDVVGTEVAGAFRNVIALAAGISDGLDFGDSAKSLLVTRGLSEMARLGVAMGGQVLTFGGLAGVGDLIAACASPHSLNHQLGRRLALGEPLDQILDSMAAVAEAVPVSAAVYRYARSVGLDLSIVKAVHAILHEGVPIGKAVVELLSTQTGREIAVLHGESA